MFEVQQKACQTCIYRKDNPLDLIKLENDVRDNYGGFKGYRVCHHSKDVCCRGFWNRHKDKFALGQIAQRLGLVRFVSVDILKKNPKIRQVTSPKNFLTPATGNRRYTVFKGE